MKINVLIHSQVTDTFLCFWLLHWTNLTFIILSWPQRWTVFMWVDAGVIGNVQVYYGANL